MQKYQELYKLLTPTFFITCLQPPFGEISCASPDNKNGKNILKRTSTALFLCASPYPLKPLQNLVTYQSR